MSEPRRRVSMGLAIPLLAVGGAGIVVFSLSRIFLAVDEALAPFVALLFALNILVAASLAAILPRKGTVAALIVAVAVPAFAAGVVGAVAGERPIHTLVAEDEEAEPAEGEPAEETPPTEEEPAGMPTKEPPAAGGAVQIAAQDIAFDTDEISLPANQEVTIEFDNRDSITHNVAILTEEDGESLFAGEIFAGPDTMEYRFRSPDPGQYFFRCDVHPDIMTGTVTVG